ncbi:MAG: molybdopterin-binding protein [Fusobacterium perfoetens]|uniref:molybdopterin-binding protein n=1 Tax=Fusobacterium perfoetens TaxID=852 RepID=UPI0023F12DC9|nr:molybdopterin-binding protein [Fusobacterium perfoetens]MCI6152626.1 molybdopterin-binding protein [Fusobacterium perfoetens]MDY3237633.1 molybdopterin-binding protein [Fusobacterium perfoetens]
MKKIKTVDAVGYVLQHDITEIVPGEFKGRAFKKGHIITEEDIPKLLKLGKDNIFVFELGDTGVHENEAAIILGKLGKGNNITLGKEVKEGKINFYAETDGILKVDVDKLLELNMLGEISFATLPNNISVKKGELVAGARVIPLVINKSKMDTAQEIIKEPLLKINPYQKYKVGIITTGNEVFYGRIEDKFGKVIIDKLSEFDCEIIGQTLCPDDKEIIKSKATEFLNKGANMLIFTGGMSVDPDDLTPSSIIEMGGELISYGAPVLPGSMFLLSYLGDIPMMGLPGCVMFAKRTVFDLVLSRVMTGEKLNKRDIMLYGAGGLCQSCDVCHYPNCSFGK